ncbi:hypothetical protein ABEB36_007393 [Hypothenemus hampei]|uniref:Methyltransferase domain-containing protein n=1 Tax=Hypothenemus hampei TaxID=57062 RepID=A0ABD1ETT7_HYPHA
MSQSAMDSIRDYLERIFSFLSKYQWIYVHKNINIFTDKVLLNFSKDWMRFFNILTVDELHGLVQGYIQDSAPEDLKCLINEIQFLNPKCDLKCPTLDSHSLPKNFGISLKKHHEISLLAPIINEICQETDCNLILDIGSGVGYLPHLLHETYNYQVLALEMSKQLIASALIKQKKFYPNSKDQVIFEEMFVNEDSIDAIDDLIKKHFGSGKKVCLTGLHACADLSVEIEKIFLKLQDVQAMVIMPCCYHRMIRKDDQSFNSFPVSHMVKTLFKNYKANGFIKEEFLRLACQQSYQCFLKMSKEEHLQHSIHSIRRALLEFVAKLENCSVRRIKRKSIRPESTTSTDIDKDFEEYLNNLTRTHRLLGNHVNHIKIDDEAFRFKMREKWTEQKNDCWQVEILMGLQAAIQPICETVILFDRVVFLKEKGVHCYKRKITDDEISPRCWAVIAKKNMSFC